MRNQIIDNLRGLCMLGVIAIHIGSLALAPQSFTLYVVLEVLSRYSVPAFFFISGYGLFLKDDLGPGFSYLGFLKQRLISTGLPYLTWSLFYLLYFWAILPPGYVSLAPLSLAYVLFFGLGCYHLYFMVILLWFHGSYPLWRWLLKRLLSTSAFLALGVLLLFQLAFNWWTTHPGLDPDSLPLIARHFFNHRLNYLPLHYLLIFMAGGLAAKSWSNFTSFLEGHKKSVLGFYLTTVAAMVGCSYYSYTVEHYTLLDLANTYHQLSIPSLFYTLGSLGAFCLFLSYLEKQAATGSRLPQLTLKAIGLLSRYSMIIYFLHPLLLEWLTSLYHYYGIVMTVKKVSLSYVLLVAFALLGSMLLQALFNKLPIIKLLFTGKK